MFDKKTMNIMAARKKCPQCGGEVRIFACTQPQRFEVRCMPCKKKWPLTTELKTYNRTERITYQCARKAVAEWNEIARKEKEAPDHEST